MKMISKGYSLWLIPKGKNYNKVSSLIKMLAREYGGPVFEPHITLLGEIVLMEEEIRKRIKELVKEQKPFTVKLKNIGYEDYHFRALFVRAELTKELQALHNKAKKIFNMDIQPYMPHLSLLYGNYPVDLKEKIISEIGRDQPAQFEISSVFLEKGGEVKKWKTIKEFPFH